MSSRLRRRSLVSRLFDVYIRFERPPPASEGPPSSNGATNGPATPQTPSVVFLHPPGAADAELVRTAAEFAFPLPSTPSDAHGAAPDSPPSLFTFVLTSAASEWTFGFVRSTGGGFASVFLTHLPHQELFFKALNGLAELGNTGGEGANEFLDQLNRAGIPEPGACFSIGKSFVVPIEDEQRLPEIPANRHLSEFFAALSPSSMLALFQSLLAERRIVIVSRRLGRLSSLCMASALLLHPMHWQHIFIPCLPHGLVDYLCAPMPFIIGVHSSIWNTAADVAGQATVVVDGDADAVLAFEEDRLPPPVEAQLLEGFGAGGLGDGLARAHLRGLAMLMGHWQDAVLIDDAPGSAPPHRRFDDELFIRLAPPAYRPYLRTRLLRLQIFRQWIEGRVAALGAGGIESDEFEREAIAWRRSGGARLALFGADGAGAANSAALRKAGRRVIAGVKRGAGGALEHVKQNSALRSALRSVKEGGKNVKRQGRGALGEMRAKFHVPLGALTPSPARAPVRAIPVHSEGSHVELAPLPSPDALGVPSPALASSASVSALLDDGARVRETRATPRLSRSEENLIDLDLGANPLYELINGGGEGAGGSGNVFVEDWDVTPPVLPLPPPRRSTRGGGTGARHSSTNHSASLGQLLDLDGAEPDTKSTAGTGASGSSDFSLLSEYGLGSYFQDLNLGTLPVPGGGGTNTNASAKGKWTTFE